MKKHLKRLSIIMLILFAGIMLNTGKAEAAAVKAKGATTTNKGQLTVIGDGYVKIDIAGLPGGECIVKIPIHVLSDTSTTLSYVIQEAHLMVSNLRFFPQDL